MTRLTLSLAFCDLLPLPSLGLLYHSFLPLPKVTFIVLYNIQGSPVVEALESFQNMGLRMQFLVGLYC